MMTRVAPLVSAALNDPGPLLFPFVTNAGGPAKARVGSSIRPIVSGSDLDVIVVSGYKSEDAKPTTLQFG